MPVTEPPRAVFLSYASQDAEAAQKFCEALRADGIEVWFDQSELRGGDAWDESIRKQIKTCALFIPIISRNTHARGEGYFRLEWKLAIDRSHQIASDIERVKRLLSGEASAPELARYSSSAVASSAPAQRTGQPPVDRSAVPGETPARKAP